MNGEKRKKVKNKFAFHIESDILVLLTNQYMYTTTIGDKDFYLSSERDGKHLRVVGIDMDMGNFTKTCNELKKLFNFEQIETKQSDYQQLFLRLCTEIYSKLN